MPSAFCLLPSAFCLLPSAFCLLPSAFCLPLHIHGRLHALVEAIGEVGGGSDKYQFLDLLGVEELAQCFQVGGLNGCRPCGELLGKLNCRTFFFCEDIAG